MDIEWQHWTYVAKHVVYFADISKVQDDEVGDGTTSVVVLACELLRVGLKHQHLHG